MSGSDGPFRLSSHGPFPSHPAGLAIARDSSAPRGLRGRPCARSRNKRSELSVLQLIGAYGGRLRQGTCVPPASATATRWLRENSPVATHAKLRPNEPTMPNVGRL